MAGYARTVGSVLPMCTLAAASPYGFVLCACQRVSSIYHRFVPIDREQVANNQFDDELNIDHFMAVDKYVLPPSGTACTPPHRLPKPFKIKDYCPKVFRMVRDRFHIDQDDYLTSLGGAYEYIEFISNSKSGQFFFYSHDGT